MIMRSAETSGASMPQSTTHAPEGEQPWVSGGSPGAGRLLQHRLELVEDLWQTVLRSECPPEQSERLLRLKQLSDPVALEGRDGQSSSEAIIELIRSMDLSEAIAAARAFSLYFQLINSLGQRIEEDSYLDSLSPGPGQDEAKPDPFDPFAPPLASQTDPATFGEVFERLRRMNVPPAQVETLLRELDIRLVFTAHPTEIVRHTVRHKQRRVANLLQRLQSDAPLARYDADDLRRQLEEEIRLWWRTDELHQFKPTVLDEVDSTLHYFQQVLFEAMPQLRRRLTSSLQRHYPDVQFPQASFCTFGSWVGSDRDGNPSVTPDITWRTACYQRQLMLELYISSVQALRNQLSISMQWSQVAPPLLESLEMDRLRFPEIYERRAARYRLEPYRLKLSYILERLERTLERNNLMAEAGWQAPPESTNPSEPEGIPGQDPLHYTDIDQFRSDLELIRNSLVSTELSCEQLDTLLHQVHIFGFSLASLDIRQESTRHSDAIDELTGFLQLPRSYNSMEESERVDWLLQELQTRRPLIPTAHEWSETTAQTFAVFRMLHRLQQEFGPRICHSYVISMSHTASDLLEVMLLAKETGLADPLSGSTSLLVVPL
ncbi:MAG: phosphoenolpyruvate carboxylase, partial [Synechococcus sp.]|nr:phosphoenolpyruvate carboxylase [Synechococcus sp.]